MSIRERFAAMLAELRARRARREARRRAHEAKQVEVVVVEPHVYRGSIPSNWTDFRYPIYKDASWGFRTSWYSNIDGSVSYDPEFYHRIRFRSGRLEGPKIPMSLGDTVNLSVDVVSPSMDSQGRIGLVVRMLDDNEQEVTVSAVSGTKVKNNEGTSTLEFLLSPYSVGGFRDLSGKTEDELEKINFFVRPVLQASTKKKDVVTFRNPVWTIK